MENTTYLIENFVTTAAGEPFRLFPFGRIIKRGKVIELTRDLAARFKLPHFKPPIKLGSHREETPAGGFIVGLEVRDDGLYAIPELTEQGMAALARGDFRYHSPEVIWEGGGLENPETGDTIAGPLIVGDALLHMPHLGEATALYSIEPFQTHEENIMADNQTDMVPLSVLDRFTAWLDSTRPQPVEDTGSQPETVTIERYAADVQERDEIIATLSARIDELEAGNAERQRRAHFAAELRETPYAGDDEFITMLTGLTDEQAAPIVERVRALSAQIDTGLTEEIGGNGHGDAVDAFEAAVAEYRKENGVDYNTAVSALMRTNPALFEAVNGGVA